MIKDPLINKNYNQPAGNDVLDGLKNGEGGVNNNQ
jgi:hypothetical protein